MKSPLMRFVGMLVWLLTALCALHEGLMALGYDLYSYVGLTAHPEAAKIVSYVFGVAGLISLVMFVGALTCRGCGCCSKSDAGSCCSKCGSCPCRCGSMGGQQQGMRR